MPPKPEVSERELLGVIKDFLEMGHLDNIVALFHREPHYFAWTGAILDDERFAVRLGVSVLFEELKKRTPDRTDLATDSLLPLLHDASPLIRGEAICVLGIIGSSRARGLIEKMIFDDDRQVRAVAADILRELSGQPHGTAGVI